jgi:hypothetical protein
MKRCLILAGLILSLGVCLRAQVTETTVCDVVKNPASFDGKMVKIAGTAVVGFDQFILEDSKDPNCGFQVDGIWISFPAGTRAKAGPEAMVTIQPARNFSGKFTPPTRTPVTLQKDKEFKQFDSQLAQTHQRGEDLCLGCARYTVTATFVGRLDGVADASIKHDAAGKITSFGGFGNMNAYPARLVLQSVSDVTPKEIDYSKNDDATKTEGGAPPRGGFGGNIDANGAIAMIQKMLGSMPSNPSKDEMEKAISVYGKQGEHTGVEVINEMSNEAGPKEDELGAKDSPDGALFNCMFNLDHLQGGASNLAVMHLGEHVADLRSVQDAAGGAPLIVLENNAWVVTTVEAVASGTKYLTMPGGYLLWSAAWPEGDRNNNMEAALKDFLAHEAQLSQ